MHANFFLLPGVLHCKVARILTKYIFSDTVVGDSHRFNCLGSAQDSAHRSSARLGSLFGTRCTSAHGSGSAWAQLGTDSGISLMLGLARLEVQLGAQLGIESVIWIRFGLAQGSARLTCLSLVLGIGPGLGSAWKPGPARGSTNTHLNPQCQFQSFIHAVNLFYLVRIFFTIPIFFFFVARSI